MPTEGPYTPGPYTPGPYNPENIPIDNALPRTDFPVMRRNPDPRPRANPWRVLTFALGVLLALSAFVLPQSGAMRVNALVSGLIIAVLSVGAMRFPTIRWFNCVVGVWLAVSTISLGPAHQLATDLGAAVAGVVFLLSLAPGPSEVTWPQRAPQVA